MNGIKIKILAVVIITTFLAMAMAPVAMGESNYVSSNPQKDAINEYLYGLNGTYDPDKMIVDEGETVKQKPYYEFEGSTEKTISVKYTKQTIDNFDQSAMMNLSSSSTKVYPGAILRADNDLAKGTPNPLVFPDRGNIVMSNTLVGSGRTFTANPQYYADVRNAIDANIDEWAGMGSVFSANVLHYSSQGSTVEQTSIGLGLDLDILEGIGINSDWEKTENKTTVIIKYVQVFYTVSAALPVDPADYFGKSTTLDQVKNKITSGSPAVYVTDVTYGRMVVAQYTTEENVDDFKLTVDLKISGNEAQLTDEQKKTLSNASFSAVVVGGDGKRTTIGSVDEINDLVSSPASLKDVKGAAMLWANMAWVDSSLHAYSYNSTEYMEKSVFVTTKIDVQVDQNAGYDLHLQVYATTYDYIDEDGNYVGLQKDVCVIDSGRLSLGEDASYDITAKHIGDVKMTLSIYSISTFFKNKTISPPPTKMIFVDSWGTLFDKNCRVTVDGNVWIEIK